MLTDANGKASYSRITGAVIIVANLVATVRLAWTGTTPQLADIPLNWAMLAGALYGLNIWKNRDKA
jgi:hypothetical protein